MNIFKGFLIFSIAMTTFVGTNQILIDDSIHNKVYADSYNAPNKEADYNKRNLHNRQLIVKFKNEVNLPYEDGIEEIIKNGNYDSNFKKNFPKIQNLN